MKKWQILSQFDPTENLLFQLLHARGMTDVTEIDRFLNPPSLSHYVELLPENFREELLRARKLIEITMGANIPIVIHGDYDADGICATAILYNTLQNELNYSNSFSFIPSRFEHGYGLSKGSIDELTQDLITKEIDITKGILLITVDSGITAVSEVAYAKELGYQVIITDHHQKPPEIPPADCIAWCDQIVGSGISWILSRVIGSKNKQDIALAALATVTDLQPLLGINRALVKKGLEVINKNPLPGLKKLLDISGRSVGEITTYELGWVVGPRINASGRLVRATDALKLFVEKDETLLDSIAAELNNTNILRQDKTLEMFALASIDESHEIPDVIFSVSEDYHEGIIGLVAAKLVQKYYRPSIVISVRDGVGKGSVRSIQGVDIVAMLRKLGNLFENLGGHPMAAGFTIKKENIAELQIRLIELAEVEMTPEHFQRTLSIDLVVPSSEISLDLIEKLEALKPFGLGNEEPVFATYGLGVVSANTVGRDKQHLLLKMFDEGRYFKGIFFNEGQKADEIALGDKVDVAYSLKRNDYEGKVSVDLIIKDIVVKKP